MGKHDILENKSLKALILARAHGLQADRYQKYHFQIGVPIVIITTISGTSAFATLTSYGNAYPVIAVIAGTLSMVAAVLAGLQTFFDFSGKATKLATATNELSMLAGGHPTDEQIAAATRNAPRVPLSIQQTASKQIETELGAVHGRGVMNLVVNKANGSPPLRTATGSRA